MDLIQELNNLKGINEKLAADYKAASELLAEATAQRDGYEARIKELQGSTNELMQRATLAEDELQQAKATIEQLKATAKTSKETAVEMVAAIGVAPIAIEQEAETLTKEQAAEQYLAIEDSYERGRFYAKHEALLLS